MESIFDWADAWIVVVSSANGVARAICAANVKPTKVLAMAAWGLLIASKDVLVFVASYLRQFEFGKVNAVAQESEATDMSRRDISIVIASINLEE